MTSLNLLRNNIIAHMIVIIRSNSLIANDNLPFQRRGINFYRHNITFLRNPEILTMGGKIVRQLVTINLYRRRKFLRIQFHHIQRNFFLLLAIELFHFLATHFGTGTE